MIASPSFVCIIMQGVVFSAIISHQISPILRCVICIVLRVVLITVSFVISIDNSFSFFRAILSRMFICMILRSV